MERETMSDSLRQNASVFDFFSIGVGPSSSHTVGPMKAAYQFVLSLGNGTGISRLQVTLHGSLAHTGLGHLTHQAILMGLEGHQPHLIDPNTIHDRTLTILQNNKISMPSGRQIAFNFNEDLVFDKEKKFSYHSNAMQFFAFDKNGNSVCHKVYYSVGGGFIEEEGVGSSNHHAYYEESIPYPFKTADELLSLCERHKLTIAELMLENEKCFSTLGEIENNLNEILSVMLESIDEGCQATAMIPGSLKLNRRAPNLYQSILSSGEPKKGHPHPMNCLNCFAMAASEQNASGGRIVTAPTNGAAGIIPAVIKYHLCFDQNSNTKSVHQFLLTAAAICTLYKLNASISGAEMGCQGEVGVACSIAAAGLAAARNASLFQIENAAEIGIEHNLGLTCDPVGGLVQIPCIERNAMGAVKAVNACSLALVSNCRGKVTLDMAIDTMRQIGQDMKTIYKETSLGGLAVNVPSC